jgi:hypothetical protein
MYARFWSLGRHALLWLCLGCGTAFGATLNGVWSYSPGGYLVLMEVQGGAVLALRVDPAMVSGEAFVGARTGDAVQVQSLSQSSTLTLSVSSDRFSGTARNSTGSSDVSGSLLVAYAGSAYDGLWQRNGDPTRYQALVTLTANTLPTTLLLDMIVNSTTTLSYDLALGTITTARTPTFRGSSLLGARTLSLVFGSTSPLTANFTAQSSAVPPQTLEQFAVAQVLPMAKASQSISFAAAPTLSVGGTATVSASASSGLTVSYSSLSTGICTVVGSTVTGLAVGTCTVAANQSGNSLVGAAAQVTQTLSVSATPNGVLTAPPIYAVVFTHIEDDTPSATLGTAQARSNYLFWRDRLIQMANLMLRYNMTWVLQPDWKFLEAALLYEDSTTMASTSGINVLRYLRDSLGVIIDPHSHEGGGYNYPDVAYLLEQLGVGGSTVIGGHVWDPSLPQFAHWERFRVPVAGEKYPSALWRGDLLMGSGTPGHTNDPIVSGMWRPKNPFNYFVDDPLGNISAVGAYKNDVAGISTLRGLYASGRVDATCMLTNTIHVYPSTISSVEALATVERDVVLALKTLRDSGQVEITHFTAMAATWKSRFASKSCLYQE